MLKGSFPCQMCWLRYTAGFIHSLSVSVWPLYPANVNSDCGVWSDVLQLMLFNFSRNKLLASFKYRVFVTHLLVFKACKWNNKVIVYINIHIITVCVYICFKLCFNLLLLCIYCSSYSRNPGKDLHVGVLVFCLVGFGFGFCLCFSRGVWS